MTGIGKVDGLPFKRVLGSSPRAGTGQLYTYTVYVEAGIDINPEGFAAKVEMILGDKRGWIRGGKVAFKRVSKYAGTQLVLAKPDTVDKLCYPLQTEGEVSCCNGTKVVVNVERWMKAVPHWPGPRQDLPPDAGQSRNGPPDRQRPPLLSRRRPARAGDAAADLWTAGLQGELLAAGVRALGKDGKVMRKAIDGVLARIKYLTKRVRRLGADAHKAEGQRKHFAKVAKDAHADYVKAEKMGKQGAMAQAKARTQRAHRKVAYWDEQADDAKHGYRRSVKRREHQRKKFRELKKIHRDRKDASSGGDTGRVMMDGRPVPGWLAHDFQKAKNAGLWSGYVVSGVRTSAQSTALCYGICGRPTLLGHLRRDIVEPQLRRTATTPRAPPTSPTITAARRPARSSGLRYTNNLPYDRVHMSATGS